MDVPSENDGTWRWLRLAGWGGAVALIATPFVLMKIAPETGFAWSAGDFLRAAVLIGTVGLIAELTVRFACGSAYRLGALIAAATGLLLIWSNLAVGYIGDGEAPLNRTFLVIPILTLAAAIIVRGQSRALAWILSAAAAAHVLTGIVGFAQDTRTGPITLVFAGLWLTSAALFRQGAKDRT